ncbi:response regulator [Geminicoccus roseus]|uniref:response regulator n=1 Tax=Geminicoccus roseus TaxID=404900 RepID=UPI0006888E3A|nr:response regulator [Geminicoccus roseus]
MFKINKTETRNSISILIVDDDELIRALLVEYFQSQGIISHEAANGPLMRQVLDQEVSIDLILLDIVMPGEDGLTLMREIRRRSNVGIIMLSSLADVIDRVTALEMGADDYLCKPFHPREVLARIRAVLRRHQQSSASFGRIEREPVYRFDGWELHPGTRGLLDRNGKEIYLTTVEFDLLMAFAAHPGQVLNRDALMDLTKGRDWAAFDRSIDQQVARLRRKIEPNPKLPSLIKTVHGAGYIFSPRNHARSA